MMMMVLGYISAAGQAAQRSDLESAAADRHDEIAEIIVEDPARLRELVTAGDVAAVIVSELNRLPAAWLMDAELFELFERHGVAVVAGAERIDSSTDNGRQALAERRIWVVLELCARSLRGAMDAAGWPRPADLPDLVDDD